MSGEFFNYQGREVSKEHFRAYVYGKDGAKKLANSYVDYKILTGTGLWFDSPEEVVAKESQPIELEEVVSEDAASPLVPKKTNVKPRKKDDA